MRGHLRAVVGLVVSAALLWWVFRGQDLAAIRRDLASAHLGLLVVTGAISTTGGLIRAIRWRLLLEPAGAKSSFRERWAALSIGFMVTNLFPGRLGEVARPLALSRIAPVSMSAALGTVALERVLDAVSILLLLLVTLMSPAFPVGASIFGQPIAHTVSVAIVAIAALLAVVGVAVVWPERIVRFAHVAGTRVAGSFGASAADTLGAFLSGLRLVRRPRALLQALLWSLVLWMWMAAAFWTAFLAFGIHLGATAAMFTECVLSLVLALPAAPGFIGTMQAGVEVSLHDVFGIASAPALSLSVGYHLAGFIPVTLIGLYYAWTVGFRLRSIGAEVETALEEEESRA